MATIAGAVAVLLTVAYFFLLLKPKLDDISEVRRTTEQARRDEGSLRNRIRALEQARLRAPEATAKLNALQLLLPQTPDLPGFIRQVQEAADGSGVNLQSIQPSRPAPLQDATGIETINVNLSVQGSFRRVEDFLVRLENLERIVEVQSVSLSPGEELVPGQLTLSTTLTLRLYVVRENARIGAPAEEELQNEEEQ